MMQINPINQRLASFCFRDASVVEIINQGYLLPTLSLGIKDLSLTSGPDLSVGPRAAEVYPLAGPWAWV